MSLNPNNQIMIVQTGIKGLDTILGGGIPVGSLIMLVGEPGTGKTTLLQQISFTWTGQKRPLTSLTSAQPAPPTSAPPMALFFSTLSEPHDKIIQHMSMFEFFDRSKLDTAIRFFSLTGIMEKERESSREVASFVVSNVRKQKANLVLIDGVGALFDSFKGVQDNRYFLNQLSSQLGLLGVTAILSLEQSFVSDLSDGLLTGADGIIGLTTRTLGVDEYHRVEIRKLRGMKRLEGLHTYRFNDQGLVFYPRLEALIGRQNDSAEELKAVMAEETPVPVGEAKRLGFGLPELEKMLSGGLPVDSSTFIAGSPGAGKTLLSLHYLMEGISRGEKGLYVGLYEGPRNLIEKGARFKLDLKKAIRERKLQLLTMKLVELEPDEVAWQITRAVEEFGVRRVVIDGIFELEVACRRDGRSRSYTSALDSYFKSKSISPMYTYTISKLIGPELDLSDTVFTALAENLLLLRQVAYQTRLYRIISILKMRDSVYDQSIREFTIENETGIKVLEPFQSGAGLLNELADDLGEASSRPVAGKSLT